MENNDRKDFLSSNSYISVSLISVISIVIIFIMEIKNMANQNRESIIGLRQEWSVSYDQIKVDISSVKKEQQFLRETMIQSMNEIRKMVYRIDGKLESFDKMYDNKSSIKK